MRAATANPKSNRQTAPSVSTRTKVPPISLRPLIKVTFVIPAPPYSALLMALTNESSAVWASSFARMTSSRVVLTAF